MDVQRWPTIEATELSQLVDAGTGFVLNLGRKQGKREIRGATRYKPGDLLDAPRLVLPLPKGQDKTIVLYGDGNGEQLEAIATKLSGDGYGRVAIFQDDIASWESSGGATQEATMEQPIPLVTEHQLDR